MILLELCSVGNTFILHHKNGFFDSSIHAWDTDTGCSHFPVCTWAGGSRILASHCHLALAESLLLHVLWSPWGTKLYLFILFLHHLFINKNVWAPVTASLLLMPCYCLERQCLGGTRKARQANIWPLWSLLSHISVTPHLLLLLIMAIILSCKLPRTPWSYFLTKIFNPTGSFLSMPTCLLYHNRVILLL